MAWKIDVLLWLQRGDEWKGKLVDYFAQNYDCVARFQWWANAWHTIIVWDVKTVLHLIPSWVTRGKESLIWKNVVLDPATFVKELDSLPKHIPTMDLLRIWHRTTITLPTHRRLDKASEAAKWKAKIGSTLKWIGPSYMDKTGRNAIHIWSIHKPHFKELYDKLKAKHMIILNWMTSVEFDIAQEEHEFFKAIEVLKKIQLVDTSAYVNDLLDQGKTILAEWAQGTLLDIDGWTYPYVTSSNTTTAWVCTGLWVSPKQIGKVIGIIKAYTTRVWNGPFPTKLTDEIGKKLQDIGHEYWATTWRPRDCGWIDLPLLRYAVRINWVDEVVVTKMDVLDTFDEMKVCTHYTVDWKNYDTWNCAHDLGEVVCNYSSYAWRNSDSTPLRKKANTPEAFAHYIDDVFAKELGVKVHAVTNGPERESFIGWE